MKPSTAILTESEVLPPNSQPGTGHKPEASVSVLVTFDSEHSSRSMFKHAPRAFKHLDPGIKLSCNLWNWDQFSHLQNASTAAQQAVDADLIIVACEGKEGLPNRFLNWVRLWASRPRPMKATVIVTVDAQNLRNPHWRGIRRRLVEELKEAAVDLQFTAHQPVTAQPLNSAPRIGKTIPNLTAYPGTTRYRQPAIQLTPPRQMVSLV